ncbi:MAG: hypothetical protein M0R46_10470 [Candidatus Muirbacterium halophilum]|nr:hypothetical protein [Candidatus Muirbacterium halophilum]
MDLSGIIKLIESHGMKSVILFLIVFFIYTLIKNGKMINIIDKIYKLFRKKIIKQKKENNKNISECDILSHDIFNYIDLWIQSKIPTIEYSTEFRTAVFRKYLIIYLESYKSKIKEFINNKEYQKMNESELWKALLDLINNIVADYEKNMVLNNIPNEVIIKMKNRNIESINLTIDLINSMCNSSFYESDKNLLKIYSILNIILSILESTIGMSNEVCNSINGKLKGMTFINAQGNIVTEN